MIQAIETRYAGCRFRSRLEARWAVFFDALGITWEYEPQGFELPSGRYLPDFQLYGLGGDGSPAESVWFEVKPPVQGFTKERGDERWHHLAEASNVPLIAAFGLPRPDGDVVWGSSHCDGWMELFCGAGWDNGRAFCTCPTCGRLGITFEGRGSRVCGHDPNADKYPNTADDPRILAAYTAARSARFEHGERGA